MDLAYFRLNKQTFSLQCLEYHSLFSVKAFIQTLLAEITFIFPILPFSKCDTKEGISTNNIKNCPVDPGVYSVLDLEVCTS